MTGDLRHGYAHFRPQSAQDFLVSTVSAQALVKRFLGRRNDKGRDLRAGRDGVGHREIVLILTGHVPGDINRNCNNVGKDILE